MLDTRNKNNAENTAINESELREGIYLYTDFLDKAPEWNKEISDRFDKSGDIPILERTKNHLMEYINYIESLKKKIITIEEAEHEIMYSLFLIREVKSEYNSILYNYEKSEDKNITEYFEEQKLLIVKKVNGLHKKETTLFSKAQDVVHSTIEKLYQIFPKKEKNESENIRLNDLGLPMHQLEIEVANLVERAKYGEKQIFPKYERAKYGDPVAYLKEHYGKYLKAFEADDNYLYQFQLKKIDSTFLGTLTRHLARKKENGESLGDLADYILPKKSYIDNSITLGKDAISANLAKANRIKSLEKSSARRKIKADIVA